MKARHPMSALSPDELLEIQRQNAEWLRPCTPAQALDHTRTMANTAHLDPPSILSALDTAIDMASVRLGRLKEASSAWKTQRGVLRGLQEARELVRANGGSRDS